LADPWERMEPTTKSRRQRLLASFLRWATLRTSLSAEALWEETPRYLDSLIADFGQALYDAKGSCSALKETVHAIIDKHKHLEPVLPATREVMYSWELKEPVQSHLPMPSEGFKAALTVALSRGYYLWAATMLIGFLCLGRPGEILGLRRSSVVLPWDLLRKSGVGFVRFDKPKTRKKGPRKQHALLAEWWVLVFLRAVFRLIRPDDLLFPAGSRIFRSLWDEIFQWLGFSTEDGKGVTPASLRAGGATLYYMLTGDLPRLQWLGRWLTYRSMCFYIQEIAAENALLGLDPGQRERVSWLADRAGASLFVAAKLLWEGKVGLQPVELIPPKPRTRARLPPTPPDSDSSADEDPPGGLVLPG
jgi:hypothetical protein